LLMAYNYFSNTNKLNGLSSAIRILPSFNLMLAFFISYYYGN